ncbi:GDSL esterase/lipase 6 [Rutidosis leptorrhynchoides]|uniref:GDSL esterase/lipase 6 n=1 Tax=Rutidosis leptorrhynchoides TaxID=125765 RepID=UPI003A98DC3D
MGKLPYLILFLSILFVDLASANQYLKSIFVFGDSQFDAGTNRLLKHCKLQANFTPYGSTFFHHPTGRFTNGRTVADFISQYMGINFQKPYEEVHREIQHGKVKSFPSNGLNFASAGSGLLPNTSQEAGVTSIQGQLQQFLSLIKRRIHLQKKKHVYLEKNQIVNSIYLIAAGGNDIFTYFLLPNTPPITQEAFAHVLLKEVSIVIRKLYMVGARRFVIFPVGPIGCIPGRVLIKSAPTHKCSGRMNRLAKYYNAGLARLVTVLPRIYPGAIVVYGATYSTTQKYRANPKQYGFANVTEACCGGGPLNGLLQCGLRGYKMCKKPNEYFFWDYFHPTERTYGLLSKGLWAGGRRQIWPINIQTLATNKTLQPH